MDRIIQVVTGTCISADGTTITGSVLGRCISDVIAWYAAQVKGMVQTKPVTDDERESEMSVVKRMSGVKSGEINVYATHPTSWTSCIYGEVNRNRIKRER